MQQTHFFCSRSNFDGWETQRFSATPGGGNISESLSSSLLCLLPLLLLLLLLLWELLRERLFFLELFFRCKFTNFNGSFAGASSSSDGTFAGGVGSLGSLASLVSDFDFTDLFELDRFILELFLDFNEVLACSPSPT